MNGYCINDEPSIQQDQAYHAIVVGLLCVLLLTRDKLNGRDVLALVGQIPQLPDDPIDLLDLDSVVAKQCIVHLCLKRKENVSVPHQGSNNSSPYLDCSILTSCVVLVEVRNSNLRRLVLDHHNPVALINVLVFRSLELTLHDI
jgi:hypothetical protein